MFTETQKEFFSKLQAATESELAFKFKKFCKNCRMDFLHKDIMTLISIFVSQPVEEYGLGGKSSSKLANEVIDHEMVGTFARIAAEQLKYEEEEVNKLPVPFLDMSIWKTHDGIVIVKDNCNHTPGAMSFKRVDSAKRHATLLFMIDHPEEFQACLFYRMMFGRESGSASEWFGFKRFLEKKNIPMPDGMFYDSSYLIRFKGEPL